MKRFYILALAVLLLVIAGLLAFAADRKPEPIERRTKISGAVPPRTVSPQAVAGQNRPTTEQTANPNATAAPALNAPLAGEQIKWQVISSGSISASSTSYRLNATAGQTATGLGSSASYKLNAGFWQSFSCCLKAGDANNDTKVNVGDAVFVINYVFKSGTAPSCKDQADANADGKVNVGDAVYLINYVFKEGTAPKCP